MKSKSLVLGQYASLPRGGYVLKVSSGILQIGSPPETIKDSILLFDDVPNIYCIGDKNFCFTRGLNISELEFPIYYNFFIKKRKTIIVGTKKKCEIFKKIINLVLFGESPIDLNMVSKDYSPDIRSKSPNIKKEISFFVNFTIDDMITFKTFDERHECKINALTITKRSDSFHISDVDNRGKSFSLEVPNFSSYQEFYQKNHHDQSQAVFFRPHFGITTLGASHGFDPYDNTSGFIFWFNGIGVMVDPPANYTKILNLGQVNPLAVNSLILTHIHADHDSGVFQKILEQNRITIYTTDTIMKLWLFKYSLITNLSINEIRKLFDFVPVKIGTPMNINGLEFNFRYMFHSTPTIGFTLKNKNSSITFSSDHLNQPSFFKQLLSESYINQKRYEELMAFPWESDFIFHEAGIPPLHTSIEYLNSLSNKIKKKIYIYHIAEKNNNTQLKRCRSGLKNTLVIDDKKSIRNSKSCCYSNDTKQSLAIIPFFKRNGIMINEWDTLLAKENLAERISLSKGSILIPDDFEQHFYVVLSGFLALHHGRKTNKVIDEKYIINDYNIIHLHDYSNPTTLNVLCVKSKTMLLKINKNLFFHEVKKLLGTSVQVLERKLKQFSSSLNHKAWEALEASDLFSLLTPNQKVDFINSLEEISPANGKPITLDLTKNCYLYHTGRAVLKSKEIKLKLGECIGSEKLLISKKRKALSTGMLMIYSGSTFFRINKLQLNFFYQQNSGVKYRLKYKTNLG